MSEFGKTRHSCHLLQFLEATLSCITYICSPLPQCHCPYRWLPPPNWQLVSLRLIFNSRNLEHLINAGKFLRLGYKSACKNNAINISQLQDERLEERILLDHWYPTKWEMSQKVCVYLGWQAFDDVVKDPSIPQGSWKSGPQTGDLPVRVHPGQHPYQHIRNCGKFSTLVFVCFCSFDLFFNVIKIILMI